MSEERFKVITSEGVLAFDAKGEGLTLEAAEDDCARRNRMAVQLGLETRYEVEVYGSRK